MINSSRKQTASVPIVLAGLVFLAGATMSCRPEPYDPDRAPPEERGPRVEGAGEAGGVGTEETAPSRLAVLWTSGDPEVATNVAFMYTLNAKTREWWGHVTLIVWGPSSNLLAENEELQAEVRRMAEEGVEVVACKACADGYGVSEALEGMGIEVKYMGVSLTEMLKDDDWRVITF